MKNNPDKIPEGYIFEISVEEKKELVENFHRFNNLKHTTVKPKTFTEKGLYMLATILKSRQATRTTISIIEAFARIKTLSRNIRELPNVRDENEKQNLLKKSREVIAELLDNDLKVNEIETSIEVNFAVLKIKHTVKKNKQNK